MDRERQFCNINEYEKLFPAIAEILNISISQLEQYPQDMINILCQAYINECSLGKDNVALALNNIINLDADSVGVTNIERQNDTLILDDDLQEHHKTERKNARAFLVSRNQIINNAHKIAEKISDKQYEQPLEKHNKS